MVRPQSARVSPRRRRAVRAGHDGTWVAHPGLVPVAKRIFDEGMPGANQISKQRDNLAVSAKDLLAAT